MLSRDQKSQYRKDLFRHLDGLVTAPTAYTLHKHGVLKHIQEKETVKLNELSAQFKANEGYLNVALRILASQGWLDYMVDNKKDEVTLKINAKTTVAFEHIGLYQDVVELLILSGDYHPRLFLSLIHI